MVGRWILIPLKRYFMFLIIENLELGDFEIFPFDSYRQIYEDFMWDKENKMLIRLIDVRNNIRREFVAHKSKDKDGKPYLLKDIIIDMTDKVTTQTVFIKLEVIKELC